MNKKVIIVDDEPQVCSSMKKILSTIEGIDVITFEKTLGAIYYLKENEADVVISDIVMPGMKGAEVCAIMRKIDPLLQVIVVTGDPVKEQINEFLSMGVFDILLKPYDPDFLKSLVLQGIERRDRLEKIILGL